MSRLAERRQAAPAAITSPAVRNLCASTEGLKLTRADQAASLVCLARALYIAMVGDLNRSDGSAVRSPDQMLASALDTHKAKALALDLDLLERDDVHALGALKPLLMAVQNWVAKEMSDYSNLQPTFLNANTR